MSEQRTLCPKCGFPSLGARIRPHNCAARIAHPERYQSPSPAARIALAKCAPGTPSTSIPKREKHEQGSNGQSSPAPGALAAPVKGAKPLTLERLDALQDAPFVGESEDAMLGRQLSEQWDKVVGGQREQLVFGAMMLKLRTHCGGVSACGHSSKTKGTGLAGWLEAHAPKVSRSTAYRLMEIAEGVQDEFRLGKRVDLETLLSAQVDNLDAALAKKRAAIEECIEGKSQRQLLLTFGKAEHGHRGGDTSTKARKLTPEEADAAMLAALREDATAPFTALEAMGDSWHVLNDAEIEHRRDLAAAFVAQADAWLKMPKSKRPLSDDVKRLIA